jgi:hypothetical protein
MTPKFRAKIQAGRIKLYPGEKLYYDQQFPPMARCPIRL